MSKHRYSKKKGKGGQLNPKKKWHHLSLGQRAYALETAGKAYIKAREQLGRPLDKNEKYRLIKDIKLRIWIPKTQIKQRFMNEFGHQENLYQRDRGVENE